MASTTALFDDMEDSDPEDQALIDANCISDEAYIIK